jgi:hypothetical protein
LHDCQQEITKKPKKETKTKIFAFCEYFVSYQNKIASLLSPFLSILHGKALFVHPAQKEVFFDPLGCLFYTLKIFLQKIRKNY